MCVDVVCRYFLSGGEGGRGREGRALAGVCRESLFLFFWGVGLMLFCFGCKTGGGEGHGNTPGCSVTGRIFFLGGGGDDPRGRTIKVCIVFFRGGERTSANPGGGVWLWFTLPIMFEGGSGLGGWSLKRVLRMLGAGLI